MLSTIQFILIITIGFISAAADGSSSLLSVTKPLIKREVFYLI